MARWNSEFSGNNIRLAVHRAAKEIFSNPKNVLDNMNRIGKTCPVGVGSLQIEDQIHSIIYHHLNDAYEILRAEILTLSYCGLSTSSVLKYLSLKQNESAVDIVQRFGRHNISHRMKSSESLNCHAAIPPEIPRLDIEQLVDATCCPSPVNFDNGRTKMSGRPACLECEEFEKSISSSERVISSKPQSTPPDGAVGYWDVENDVRLPQFDDITERVSRLVENSLLSNLFSLHGTDFNTIQLIKDEVTKLVRDVISSISFENGNISCQVNNQPFESVKENKNEILIPCKSRSSSQRSEEKTTFRFIPSKIATIDVGVGTEPVELDQKCVDTAEIGVNTALSCSRMNSIEGSSSNNTLSELSTGQVPESLVDDILRRSCLKVFAVRPDGSIVMNNNAHQCKTPIACEWEPYPLTLLADSSPVSCSVLVKRTHDERGEIERVSAVASLPHSVSEEDTLAQVSPLPRYI